MALGFSSLFTGLGALLQQVEELAKQSEGLQKAGEIHDAEGKLRGVFGFTVRTCGGAESGVKVEPFGNVRKDERTGHTVVDEVREPLVDIFEERDHLLVVAEMPGISAENVQLELVDDVLSISATRGEKKYRKEVLLPEAFPRERMSHTCRNGVLEVRLQRSGGSGGLS